MPLTRASSALLGRHASPTAALLPCQLHIRFLTRPPVRDFDQCSREARDGVRDPGTARHGQSRGRASRCADEHWRDRSDQEVPWQPEPFRGLRRARLARSYRVADQKFLLLSIFRFSVISFCLSQHSDSFIAWGHHSAFETCSTPRASVLSRRRYARRWSARSRRCTPWKGRRTSSSSKRCSRAACARSRGERCFNRKVMKL